MMMVSVFYKNNFVSNILLGSVVMVVVAFQNAFHVEMYQNIYFFKLFLRSAQQKMIKNIYIFLIFHKKNKF